MTERWKAAAMPANSALDGAEYSAASATSRQGDVLTVATPDRPVVATDASPQIGGRIILALGKATEHAHSITVTDLHHHRITVTDMHHHRITVTDVHHHRITGDDRILGIGPRSR